MPTVSLTVDLQASADTVWRAVKSPLGFRFVSRGLVRWPIAEGRNTPWVSGETVRGWIFAAGIVPVAFHELTFVLLDDDTREFRTDEHGGFITRWNHNISVTPITDSTCRIDDTVTFSGGIVTPLLTIAVRVFYAIRRYRWVSLARALSTGALVP